MESAARPRRRDRRLRASAATLVLAVGIAGCAAPRGPDLEEFLAGETLPYRLITQEDFRARTSSSPWGNVAHGAEICTLIVPTEDHERSGAFQAVMNPDCSFWNRIAGPLGFFGRIAAIATGVPVPVPVKQPDWYILQHEQIHFAINEVAARRLSRKIAELPPSERSARRIERAYHLTRSHTQQRHWRFDEETSGTYRPSALEKWVRVLEIEMQDLCEEGLECRVRNPSR